MHITDWVAQAAVLDHASVVVCHGGSGTTVGTLAAGALVVTPLFADQPSNARRVAAIGAGVVVEPTDAGAIRSAVDPGALQAAITTVLTDDRTHTARRVAAGIRRLPPVDDAVAVLHAMT